MNEEPIRYGAGGVPYKPKGVPASEPVVPVELEIEEPAVVVSVTEDDRPLTDEQVIKKVTGKK